MHIYAALASGEQNLCIFTQLSLHRCNGGLHQERAGRLNATGGCIRRGRGRLCLHRAGSVQTEKIAFASSRLGANGKDCVCIESARCKQKRLRLHRAGCICIEHNQLTCQPVGQTTTTRATRKLLEMLVFTRVSGFTVFSTCFTYGWTLGHQKLISLIGDIQILRFASICNSFPS